MSLVLADRVQETTTTTGTGTLTLAGAVAGYQSFAAIGNGNSTYYCITDGTNWEIGIGTYTLSGTTLSRTTVLASSNSGALVSFAAGTKTVFVALPAEKFAGTDRGDVVWQGVQASSFTAVAGCGYPVNTTSAAITATLPASPTAGQSVTLTDYARTFATNNLTVNPNGNKIDASTSNVVVNTNGASVSLVYIDSTQGWIAFNGFQNSPIGSYSANYLVVAGGGGGGGSEGGGGGGGGVLTGSATLTSGTAYTITVGAGGAGGPGTNTTGAAGSTGTNSSISTVATALAGGGGGGWLSVGLSGGSGGGGAQLSGGTGTSGQGYAGGSGYNGGPYDGGGGGGGASSVGANGTSTTGGNGGAGVSNSISGSAVNYAGGGGGGTYAGGTAGSGGVGGAGNGSASGAGSAATANTGGGGGGGFSNGSPYYAGGNGGSGIVIISYYGPQRGTGGTVTSSGGYTIHTFTTSGTYTA